MRATASSWSVGGALLGLGEDAQVHGGDPTGDPQLPRTGGSRRCVGCWGARDAPMDPAGSRALGRGVVIGAGEAVPPPWSGRPGRQHRRGGAWPIRARPWPASTTSGPPAGPSWSSWPSTRRASASPSQWRGRAVDARPRHEVWLDRLHFLVWANTYDARTGDGRAGGGRTRPAGVGADADARRTGRRRACPTAGRPGSTADPRAPVAGRGSAAGVLVHAESVELGRLSVVPPPVAPTADLAPDQLAAVAHGAGPARIIAPAGSGKTRVLTERLRHLIADRGYEPDTLLAVAYNVKARDEMAERTAGLGARVQTLNGSAYGVLADHRGGAPPVIDEREVRRILDRLAPHAPAAGQHRPDRPLPRGAHRGPPRPARPRRGRARAGRRARASATCSRPTGPSSAPGRGRLRRAGLRRRRGPARRRRLPAPACRPATATCWSTSSRTSPPPTSCSSACSPHPPLDVFGVGDDDQAIYGHAGADPRFLDRLRPALPGGRRPPARGQLPLPGARWSRPPATCCPTTSAGWPRRSAPGPAADRTPTRCGPARRPAAARSRWSRRCGAGSTSRVPSRTRSPCSPG